MMKTVEDQQAEECVAIENERRAFERRQAVLSNVTKQFYPQRNGQPAIADLDDLNAADAEWKVANAVVEQIIGEIQSGKRH